MTYPEAIQYLESFINYEKVLVWPYKESLKLERIRGFLGTINNPQDSLKCIHIAGSKGKGSTCAFLTYILREAGYRVGLYTSPHLSDFRERIRILECQSVKVSKRQRENDFEGTISQDELSQLVDQLKPEIEKCNKNSKYDPLSFFEVYTALAFVYFKEKKVDFAVLETGLGGRLDATNVVNPLVCAITPISYEHTQKLGNTLREIATEKVGIIKVSKCQSVKVSKPIVITAPQEKEAMEVIRKKCKVVGARLYAVNKDIFYEKTAKGFSIMGIFDEYPNLEINLLGRHQIINATVAIGVIEALRFYNIIIDTDSIRAGLYNTVWPGRCEVVARNPLVVLDGAQNIASSRTLKGTIKENFKYRKLILVLGISNDKDIKGICNELSDLTDEVVLTKSTNPRATSPKVLAQYFDGKIAHKTNNVKKAKAKAFSLARKEDLILVTGSLFVVGEFRDNYNS
jgi:dihydrofolate synthase/folylpolyglutamate synthase